MAIAVDTTAFASLLPKNAAPNSPLAAREEYAAMFGPLIEKASAYAVGFDVEKGLNVELLGESPSDAAAKEVGDTLSAVITLGKNMIETMRKQLPNDPIVPQMFNVVEPLLKNARTEVRGDSVQVRSETNQDFVQVLNQFLPTLITARQRASNNVQGMNNMRQIMLAFHNYHDVYGHFPPPVLKGKNGATHSWRVAILPYLDQSALYDAYKFDEPWDSPSNHKVLEKMPTIYRHPSQNANATTTNYVAPVSPDGVMRPTGEGTKIQEILDGTSNTIMLVEAKSEIPWTRPEDHPLEAEGFQRPRPQDPRAHAERVLCGNGGRLRPVLLQREPPVRVESAFQPRRGERSSIGTRFGPPAVKPHAAACLSRRPHPRPRLPARRRSCRKEAVAPAPGALPTPAPPR